MLVIITEDSKSGLKFWNIIKQLVLKNSDNVIVQVARPKNHVTFGGTNHEIGGITNVRYELEHQLKHLTNLGGNHHILLAIDNVTPTGSSAALTYALVKTLMDYIRNIQSGKVKNSFNLKNISIQATQYYCFEEIFLTFKYLGDFTGVSHSPSNTKRKAEELYNLVYNTLCNPDTWTDYSLLLSESDRNFLYKKYKYSHRVTKADMYNREVLASLILEYITSSNKDLHFKVSKKKIDSCWYTDCKYKGQNAQKYIQKGKDNSLMCNNCKVCNLRYGKGSTKIGMLLTNSSFIKGSMIDIKGLQKYI